MYWKTEIAFPYLFWNNIVNIMFLSGEKFGQVCYQPPHKFGGLQSSRSLALTHSLCMAFTLIHLHTFMGPRKQSNLGEYEPYAAGYTIGEKIFHI